MVPVFKGKYPRPSSSSTEIFNVSIMPRTTLNSSSKVHGYVTAYPTEFEATPRKELFCKLCSIVVPHDRKSSVEKHRTSAKHQISLTPGCSKQTLLTSGSFGKRNDFTAKVTDAFLSADIPLYKLNNPRLKDLFLSMGHALPSETSCRKQVGPLAEAQRQQVIALLSAKDFFMVVDEAEVAGKKFVNTLVGDVQNPTKTYLISSKVRNKNMFVVEVYN